MTRSQLIAWSCLCGAALSNCLVSSFEADLPEPIAASGASAGDASGSSSDTKGGSTQRTAGTTGGVRADSTSRAVTGELTAGTSANQSTGGSSIGISSVSGGTAGASVRASAGNGSGNGNGNGGTTGIVCGTTPSKFNPIQTVFAASSSLAGSGFHEQAGNAKISSKVIEIANTPTPLCTSGCLHLRASFAAGDQRSVAAVVVEQQLPNANNNAGINLVGASIVAKVSIENPNKVPVAFEIFSQGPAPEWAWAGAPKDPTELGDSKAFKESAYPVVDKKSVDDGQTVTFCASNVVKYGFKLQASKDITVDNKGTVDAYIQSVTVYPAGGYKPAATGAGGTAGAGNVGRNAGGMAGVAGTKR